MPSASKFTLGLVQMACSPDAEQNLRQAVAWVERAARSGAEIVCLPELFRSLYFCQREDHAAFELAESVPGPTTEILGRIARDNEVVIVAPLFERRAPGLYHNTAAVIDATGDLVGIYRKMHIPDDPAYYEKFYFAPGDLGFRCFDTRVGRIGVLICWDQWFPEAARLVALQGASVIFYPTAIGWHPQEKDSVGAAQRAAWRTIQRGHAIANGVYVAVVNRHGLEVPSAGGEGVEFWGSSFVCDPFGVVVAEASVHSDELLLAKVSRGRIEEVRRHWPFLRDRRVDAYGGINSRYCDDSQWKQTP